MKHSDYLGELERNEVYNSAKKKLRLRFQLADALLRYRIENDLSQNKLALLLGTKQANISRLESGLANPTLDFLTKLSDKLDIKIIIGKEKENKGFIPEYFVIIPEKKKLWSSESRMYYSPFVDSTFEKSISDASERVMEGSIL